MTNLLLNEDGTNHGDAFYMLTGTNDFEYTLDLMVINGQIDQETADTFLTTQDGYRLRFMMVGMKTALDTDGDTEAICLFNAAAEGVMCAGLQYNGSSIVSYGEWIGTGIFTANKASATMLNETGVDQSYLWYP